VSLLACVPAIGAEENRSTWQQPGVAPPASAGPSGAGSSGRKRGAEDLADDDDDMPEDVKRRLAALKGQA